MTARYDPRWSKWSCPCGGRVVAVDGASPHCARCAELDRSYREQQEQEVRLRSRKEVPDGLEDFLALAEQVEAGWRAFWAKRNQKPPRVGLHNGGLTL